MAVRSLVDQTVTLPAIDLRVDFTAGEVLRTEISTKFRRAGAERELAAAGLSLVAWWTDAAGDFAVCLARPRYPATAPPTVGVSGVSSSADCGVRVSTPSTSS